MYISGPREDHSVEFLLVGKNQSKGQKTFCCDWQGWLSKDKVPFFLKRPEKWDEVFFWCYNTVKSIFVAFLEKMNLTGLENAPYRSKFWVWFDFEEN